MEANELINVTVEYDTVKMTARHSFGANIYALTDINKGTVSITRDGQMVRQLHDLTVAEYERILLSTAKDAEMIKRFNNEL
ncbi:hypothetical protein [Anaerophaga thermohalophila]|jgi:hypothetical protein|uniref:hypothetical protein n=1 Tax=Anaerophaga thermohalophila TaxID=177400 RepID=UPI000237C833|nr:hypothetical protein [Anaerophaga thermohalophila]